MNPSHARVWLPLREALLAICLMYCLTAMSKAEEGKKLLELAIGHVGDDDILTGEFEYTLTVTDKRPSDKVIQRRVEEHRALLRTQLEGSNNQDFRQRIQTAIETADKYLPPQLVQNAARTIQYRFILGGPSLGGDRYVEFSVVDKETDRPGPAVSLLQRSLGSGKGLSLLSDARDGIAVAGPTDVSSGTQEPQRLGRIVGWLGSLADQRVGAEDRSLDKVFTNIDVDAQDANGSASRDVTGKIDAPDGPIGSIKCRIDPSRGFITPFVEELDKEGRPVREWTSEDYFQPPGTTLWFPGICTFREFKYDSEDVETRIERYVFSQDGVLLNNAVPDIRFKVKIPRGRPLFDRRSGTQRQFAVTQDIDLSIDDLDNIGQIAGIKPFVPTPAAVEETALEPYPVRLWLVAANIVVLIGVVAWLIIRKRGVKKSHVILLAISLAASSGCGNSASVSLTAGFSVTPAQVGLGEVAVDGGEIKFAIQVKNETQYDVQIEIVPSCGCTTADRDSFALHSNESQNVEMAISTRGRVGPFKSEVKIKSSAGTLSESLREIVVPIEGLFRDDWTARPQRIVLNKGGDGTLSGILSVSAPPESWKDVIVGAMGTGIDVFETSSNNGEQIETRKYRVSGESSVDTVADAVVFYRGDRNNPFLSVPVLKH